MQKLLLSGLMVCVMAMPALAGLNFPDIDVKGNLSLKSIATNDYDGTKTGTSDKTDSVQLLADLKLSSELTENVGLNVVLRNVSTQGGIFTENPASMEKATTNNYNIWGVLYDTTVYQVYLTVKDIAGVNAVIGRQNIGEKKNSLVYQKSNADAIKLSRKCGPVSVTCVSANGPDERDTLNAIMLNGKIGPVNASLAQYTAQSMSAPANGVLDLTVSGKIPVACGIDASLEFAKQSSKKTATADKVDATAMLIKLGCGGCDTAVGKASCGLTILNTSGDKSSSADKNEDYTGINPSLKLTEIVSDIAAGSKNDDLTYKTTMIGNRNAIVINLGLAPAAVAGLNLGLAYGTYKLNEVSSGSKDLATEINLTAGYKASDAVSLSLLLAQMTPGKAMSLVNTDKATKIQAGMKIAF